MQRFTHPYTSTLTQSIGQELMTCKITMLMRTCLVDKPLHILASKCRALIQVPRRQCQVPPNGPRRRTRNTIRQGSNARIVPSSCSLEKRRVIVTWRYIIHGQHCKTRMYREDVKYATKSSHDRITLEDIHTRSMKMWLMRSRENTWKLLDV